MTDQHAPISANLPDYWEIVVFALKSAFSQAERSVITAAVVSAVAVVTVGVAVCGSRLTRDNIEFNYSILRTLVYLRRVMD